MPQYAAACCIMLRRPQYFFACCFDPRADALDLFLVGWRFSVHCFVAQPVIDRSVFDSDSDSTKPETAARNKETTRSTFNGLQ